MQPQRIESLERPPSDPIAVNNGVLVLTGYGLDIRVKRGQLQVRDGIGRQRREGQIHRATGRLRRLVVLGHTGVITLDAIRWLADIGAGYVQIDRDGRVLAAFGPRGTDRPTLRRAQALATATPSGVAIGRELVRQKVLAQAATLEVLSKHKTVDPAAPEAIASLGEALTFTHDIDGLRLIEAHAAVNYWGCWSTLPIRFARRDLERVPAHWQRFGSRSSPLTGGPRLAANPANALLNYLYALLEAEATVAALAVGLDPGLGIIHADQLNRDSLSADLMEPVRPLVDRHVVELLVSRTFTARDFVETREGVCRVTAPLAAELAATTRSWGLLVGRVAEDVARALDVSRAGRRSPPTPLTGRNRGAGRGAHSKGVRIPRAKLIARCLVCGGPTVGRRITCSPLCEAEQRQESKPAFIEAGRANLAKLRAEGWQPVLTEDARQRIGRRASENVRDAREWQRTHRWPGPEEYRESVLPALEHVSAAAIARATGLSLGYAIRIGRGDVTPHPRWWERLASIARTPEAV